MPNDNSQFKPLVSIGACLAPVVGGAIIYYSLKNTDEGMAKFGNRLSWLAIPGWIIAFLVAPNLVSQAGEWTFLAGTASAIIAVVQIKKAHRSQPS